ncbi:MAG TPA: type VI secretion IcmF C-terminal domain-containing protein, partial [Methylibium sp.]
AVIDPRFEALKRYVAGSPGPLDDALALLGRLATHLIAVDDALTRKLMPPASDASRELASRAQLAPEPLQAMLGQLAQTSAAQELAALREPLARRMASELTPACLRALAGRYPLQRTAREEVSRAEFSRMFASGGVIDGFFQRYLAPYADTTAHPWAYRAVDGSRVEPSESLPQFQRAQRLREAYFHDNGRTLGARLEFRLLELDAGIGQFTLDVDGQALHFGRESKLAQAVYWPAAGGTGRVKLQVVPMAGGSGSNYVFEGPWALFRLFDRVRIDPGPSADRMQLLFDVEGRKARFEVRSMTSLNPLLRGELEQFQCPKRP